MENAQWESKYNQLLVTHEEFQRSSRELEEDLESDLQRKEEQLLGLSRQLEKLKISLSDYQKHAEKERHAAALQNDRLLTQLQVLKDSANADKKLRVRLEQANDDLEGHLRSLQRENEEATERLETAIDDQVMGQQDYEDTRKELQHVQEQLQKAEKLIERLEHSSKASPRSVGETALIDSLRAEIDALKQPKRPDATQPTARMRRLEGLQKIAKQREERLARQSVGKGAPTVSSLIGKAGTLDKKERSLRSWKTQFCQINVTDRTLELFVIIPGSQEGGNVHRKVGSLRLSGCQLVVKRQGKRQFALQPSHSKNKTVFRCQSDEDLEQWLEALQLGITDIPQGPDANSFLRGRSRTQTLTKGEVPVADTTSEKPFVWQKDALMVKEGFAKKLKYGCEGTAPSEWDTIGLRLALGSSLLEIYSLQTLERRGAISLLVYERGELGLTRFRTDAHSWVPNVLVAHSGPFEYVLQFASMSERMEWMRAIRYCTTPREHDVRLEGSLFLPALKAEDPPRETYCTLLLSRVNPGIMNFFDAASNELLVVRCFRLAKACQLSPCQDPCAFTLTQTDSVMLKAKNDSEAKQWMNAIAAVLADLEDPATVLLPRYSEGGKPPDESNNMHKSASDAFSFRASVSESEGRSSLSVDVSTRSKSGRLLEMNNSLIGVSWKPRFFSIDATSRMLEYSQVGKRCVSKNCNSVSESGGYCQQCMRKIMDGTTEEESAPRTLSRTASFLQKLGGGSISKFPTLETPPRERTLTTTSDRGKPHFISLARAVVVALPPKKAGGRSHCFLLTPHHSKRDYVLQAVDEQDMLDWIEVLSSRTKMEELPVTSMKGLLSIRNVRATGTIVPWRPRWFVLEGNVLIHRKGEQEKAGQVTITLTPNSHVGVVEGHEESSVPFEFCLTDSEQKDTTHFMAENKALGMRWLSALEKVIRHEQSLISTEPPRRVSDEKTLSPPSLFNTISPPSSPSPSTSSSPSTNSSPNKLTSNRSTLSPSSILVTGQDLSVPPPGSRPSPLAVDLSASRLETELMQQKSELEVQLRKREAELRQRDAELEEAKRLIIHLRADGHGDIKNLDAKLLYPKEGGSKGGESKREEEIDSNKKIITKEVDRKRMEEDYESKQAEKLEEENAQLKLQLLVEKEEREKITGELARERQRTESVSKTVEVEKEKREIEEATKLASEKTKAKKLAEEEAKRKKLKETEKFNAKMKQEDDARQMEAEKRRVHLENQWLVAEAEKQKLMREYAEQQKDKAEKLKDQAEKQKVQAEKQKLLADKQRQEAEVEKKQAERQRIQSERHRIEAEADRKRLATEVGRRAHLQNQWMLAEQEKQRLLEEEKIRLVEAGKQLKEKEIVVEAEKQRLLEAEKKKEEADRLFEQQRKEEQEQRLIQLKNLAVEAEREKQRLIEAAEKENLRLREEAEKERLRLQEELEKQKREQDAHIQQLEVEKERLRAEQEQLREQQAERKRKEQQLEQERKLKEQQLEQDRKLRLERQQIEQDKKLREQERAQIQETEANGQREEEPVVEHRSRHDSPERFPASSSPPCSPPLVFRPTQLDVPRDPDVAMEPEDKGSLRRLRKAPPKFGTLQNLQKPIDVASLRNMFETKEKGATLTSPLKEGTLRPPPPPPDAPLPKNGLPSPPPR